MLSRLGSIKPTNIARTFYISSVRFEGKAKVNPADEPLKQNEPLDKDQKKAKEMFEKSHVTGETSRYGNMPGLEKPNEASEKSDKQDVKDVRTNITSETGHL
ncbi:hypothetical protein AKO1_004990 [Acrasis kona]|uniref:Uncharacterized protein n=1 Tax=Acrasis kona TaxID=1008807 RepID=A0AAW2Z6N9_9EUKA